jgi:hypothetical protein
MSVLKARYLRILNDEVQNPPLKHDEITFIPTNVQKVLQFDWVVLPNSDAGFNKIDG